MSFMSFFLISINVKYCIKNNYLSRYDKSNKWIKQTYSKNIGQIKLNRKGSIVTITIDGKKSET